MEPTHQDLKQALQDLHQWVLDHPGAVVIPADEGGMLGFGAFTEPVETEQSFSVRIPLHHAKNSHHAMPDTRLKRNLGLLIKGTGGRRTLCSILSTPNGWHELVTGDAALLETTSA